MSKTRPRATFAASNVSEKNVAQGVDWNGVYRDRYSYQRATVLDEALLAWRLNPLARAIVELFQQYTVDGIEFECAHAPTFKFLKDFWNHDLNQVTEILPEWADEYVLTGNAFPLISTDAAGMSYLRIHPTDLIEEINTKHRDVRQETGYMPKATQDNSDPKPWPNFYAAPRSKRVMLHSAVNRLAGMKWGEPDLAPLLPWLARYANWLEDRVRLNRYRNAFMWQYKANFKSEAEKEEMRLQLQANPPPPGSILVTDTNETWEALSPKLDSFDANADGMALKKFIAAGRVPLHYLAEPESSTRTTADAAGTPTFKRFERRQDYFKAKIKELLTVVVHRRRLIGGDSAVDPNALIIVRAADVSERDNAALALATSQIVVSMKELSEQGYITPEEFLRFVYKFAGETVPADAPKPKPVVPKPQPANAGGIKVDAETGDVTTDEQ
jgi:hypothetical protein